MQNPRRKNLPLDRLEIHEMLGLNWGKVPESSFTIGIDTIEKMVAKLHERANWSIYKIKLGTAHDVDIVQQLRNETDAVFRVDANCGWTAEEAISSSIALQGLGVEFIEQPLPADAWTEDHRRVYCESALPIVAGRLIAVEFTLSIQETVRVTQCCKCPQETISL